MAENILVQMRLKTSTVNQVNRLCRILKNSNRADVVRTAIDIAYLVTEEIGRGKDLIIYPPRWKFWRRPQRVIIPGING